MLSAKQSGPRGRLEIFPDLSSSNNTPSLDETRGTIPGGRGPPTVNKYLMGNLPLAFEIVLRPAKVTRGPARTHTLFLVSSCREHSSSPLGFATPLDVFVRSLEDMFRTTREQQSATGVARGGQPDPWGSLKKLCELLRFRLGSHRSFFRTWEGISSHGFEAAVSTTPLC